MSAFDKSKIKQLEKMLLKGRLINQADAAKVLHCHPRTIRRYLAAMKKKGLKFHYSYSLKKYQYEQSDKNKAKD